MPYFSLGGRSMGSWVVLLALLQISDAKPPATAEQAATVLDLATFPLVNAVGEANTRVIAAQSYKARGNVLDVAGQLRTALRTAGFEEQSGATFTDNYASGTYLRDGYVITLSVFSGNSPHTVSVALQNHGNVDLTKLPVPAGSRQLYALPAAVTYVSELSLADARQECRRLLADQGWQPFGETAVSFFVKQNAVRLQVMISEAPAQGGKTTIQFSSEQLSVDLPRLPRFESLQYADATCGMLLDSRESQEALVAYFKQALQPAGWQPTTEQPITIDFRDHLIFRNPRHELLELQFYEVDGLTRTDLRFQTAAQVAATDERVQADQIEQQRRRDAETERKQHPPKIAISSPPHATVGDAAARSIEFATKSGLAKASLEQWMEHQQTLGWNKTATIDSIEVGEFILEKDGARLEASFLDPGFIPGSITIEVSGDYVLELSK